MAGLAQFGEGSFVYLNREIVCSSASVNFGPVGGMLPETIFSTIKLRDASATTIAGPERPPFRRSWAEEISSPASVLV